jgi:hypothetical protein
MKRNLMTMVAGLAALALASLAMGATPAAAGGALGGVEDRGYSDNSTGTGKFTTWIEFYNYGRKPYPRYQY